MIAQTATNRNLELRCLRIFDPTHIPREYIEQIKEREFEVDRFYEFQKTICLHQDGEKFSLNPCNLLFAIVDTNNRVKGVLWMAIDVLGNSLVINTFSVDKEFWGNGTAINLLKEKAIEIKEGAELDRIYWITRCPKHSERYGFKRSKNVLMEFKGYGQLSEGNIHGVGCEASGEYKIVDSRAEQISKVDARG